MKPLKRYIVCRINSVRLRVVPKAFMNFKMQMLAVGLACITHRSDDLSLLDALACAHLYGRHVGVNRLVCLSIDIMGNKHDVSIT